MKWQTVTLPPVMHPSGLEYLDGVETINVNDDNEWYCYNDGWTAKNTEIYVDKGKPTLLITLGESWTYGEGTRIISHRHHKWQIRDRIEVTYSGKMARLLDSDLWTFGLPGNSNSGIFTALFRILDNIPKGRYESIKVAVLMTACDRDRSDMIPDDHPLQGLIHPDRKFKEEEKITFDEWLVRYDEVFFGLLDKELKKHSDLNIDAVVFKNFNKIWTPRRDYNFRIMETFWLGYHAAWYGVDLTSCNVMHPDFYKIALNSFNVLKDFDIDYINGDFDNWEKLVAFLEINNELTFAAHPTETSHYLWTKFLLDYTGWKSVTKV
jgi:hypothetical protein